MRARCQCISGQRQRNPGATLLFFFEVPKERYSKAKPGWVKLLRKLKLP